jgi:hypothetical protein
MKRTGFWTIGQMFFDGEGAGAGAGEGAGGEGAGADDKVTLTKAELDGRIAQAVGMAVKKVKKEAGTMAFSGLSTFDQFTATGGSLIAEDVSAHHRAPVDRGNPAARLPR